MIRAILVDVDGLFKEFELQRAQQIPVQAQDSVFDDLGKKLVTSIKWEFDRRVGKGTITWHGDLARGTEYKTHVASRETAVLEVTEGAPHGVYIRQGTSPGYRSLPGDVVDWAMDKLNVDKRVAFAIARSVQQEGTADSLVSRWPIGERRFDYPEYIVRVKNVADIQKAADMVGNLIVQYINSPRRAV